MKLNRMIVHGFKSFKDKTVIHFNQGVTGIVGPNGCGKSNIVDGLFWVMGEQSAKHLRGTSMKDVIFAGSSKYPPAAWAEVTLVLGNESGKHIHIGDKIHAPTEIQLSRKLYRNGESEYRINSMPCRLKDIQEVFMDTGVGAKSYSIIAQGEVNRLVQSSPQDKRIIIEEIAGITKYKLRKKDSLKKMDHAQENLKKLDDLKSEVGKHLKRLESQAEKAEKAKVLKEKVRKYELSFNAHKEFDFLKDFREGSAKVNESNLALEKLRLNLEKGEVFLEDNKLKKIEYGETLDALQSEYNQVSKMLAAGEERLSSLGIAREDRIKQIDLRQKENDDLVRDCEENEKKLSALEEELQSVMDENEYENLLQELEEKVDVLKQDVEGRESDVRERKAQLEKLKLNKDNLEKQHISKEAKVTDIENRIGDFNDSIGALETDVEEKGQNIVSLTAQVGEIKTKLETCNVELAGTKALLTEKEGLHHEIDRDFKVKQKNLLRSESRLQSLQELGTDAAGKGEKKTYRDLRQENDFSDRNWKSLGELVQCEDEYAQCVQKLLQEHLEDLVLGSDAADDSSMRDDWSKLLDWGREAQKADLKLLSPLAFETSEANSKVKADAYRLVTEQLVAIFGAELRAMGEILIVPKDEREVGTRILELVEGMYVVPDLSSDHLIALQAMIIELKKDSQNISDTLFPLVIGDKKGEVWVQIDRHGFRTNINFGTDGGQGIIFRNNEIQRLIVEGTQLRSEVVELEKSMQELAGEITVLRQKYQGLYDEQRELATTANVKTSHVTNIKDSLVKEEQKLVSLKFKKATLSEEKLEILEDSEKIEEDLAKTADLWEETKQMLEELESDLEMKREQFFVEKEELLKCQSEKKGRDFKLQNLQVYIKDVERQIQKQQERDLVNKNLINEYEREVTDSILILEKIREGNTAYSLKLKEKTSELSIVKDQASELFNAVDATESELKETRTKINKIEKDLVLLHHKAQQLLEDEGQCVRNILEKYRVNLRDCVGRFLEIPEEDLRGFQSLDEILVQEAENGPQQIALNPYQFVRKFGQELTALKEKLKESQKELNQLGDINWTAIEEYTLQKERFDFLVQQEGELKKSLEDLNQTIEFINTKSKLKFREAFEEVNARFTKVFPILFGGGFAELRLVGEESELEAGVEIIAQPPGKKMQNINLMSGGEKAMTAVSLIFSTFLVRPSPFCLLDEVDAPLDDANVVRFNELLREMSSESQFIVITHNKKTMELNDVLYGVTMQEPGVSKAVSVQLQ